MFYPAEALKRGGRFYLCWVADSWPLRFATITHRQLWSQDIRKICDDLLEVVRNESGRPKNRFSLRLSCQLLRGLVRLYQRKVTVFVGDLCMINALVMKSSNKKFSHEISGKAIYLRSELPRLVFEEPDDEKVEEQIQNSGNVANVQDITLKEPTLPENRMLLDDGFGELHPDQPLQLFDRTVEMMMVPETSAHTHSALDLPVDISDKSQDKSRLMPHEAQMERISEHDITVFRKSVPEDLLAEENDILAIPEIPPPTVPEPANKEKYLTTEVIHTSKDMELEELILEELEPHNKKRKLKNKLIIDKKIRLSSSYIRGRIENINVELRCEEGSGDAARVAAPAQRLLCGPTRPLGAALARLLRRAAGAVRDPDMPLAKSPRASHMRPTLAKIVEEVEPVDKTTENTMAVDPELEMMKQVDLSRDIQMMDISDLPTEKILTESQMRKRNSDLEISPKRQRKCGVTSYRTSVVNEYNEDANKENVPNIQYEARSEVQQLSAMIRAAGLADVDTHTRADIDRTTLHRRPHSHTSETPLGSLDRTKVSLGDSERTTDSKKIIRDEWGTAATMHKIYKHIKEGLSRVTVDTLLRKGPTVAGHKRLIAARCFSSILKLKQHGFIVIHKDSVTKEIVHIELGEKVTRKRK